MGDAWRVVSDLCRLASICQNWLTQTPATNFNVIMGEVGDLTFSSGAFIERGKNFSLYAACTVVSSSEQHGSSQDRSLPYLKLWALLVSLTGPVKWHEQPVYTSTDKNENIGISTMSKCRSLDLYLRRPRSCRCGKNSSANRFFNSGAALMLLPLCLKHHLFIFLLF